MKVYIVLTDTRTLFTRMLKIFTKHSLNHASISFTKELDQTYSFGRKSPHNPLIGGFVKEDLGGELFDQATCAIYSCSVSEFEYEQMDEMVQKMEKQQRNYKYNFIGLFGVLFNKKINRKNAYFCSEFVATILNHAGISFKNKPACLVKPKDLIECKNVHFVFEGELRSYLLQQSNDTVSNRTHDTMKSNGLFTSYSISTILNRQ
jgi:hypothetical protein